MSNRTGRIATAPVPPTSAEAPSGGHALVVALGEVQRRGDPRRLQALALVHAVAHLVAEPRTAAVRAGRLAQKRSHYNDHLSMDEDTVKRVKASHGLGQDEAALAAARAGSQQASALVPKLQRKLAELEQS